MFQAILDGDTAEVKVLLARGFDKHAVMHSPVRWEGVSMLGAASHEGHIEIVRLLVDVGTSVNFSDPCLGRTALHWACLGNQYQIVAFLIRNGAYVNHADKDGCTPLHRAVLGRNHDITKLLIENGADVNQTDILQCSILHYGSIIGDKNIVKTAIKAGCILNNSTALGKGTPLENLIHQKDSNNVVFLLEAGYSLKNDLNGMTTAVNNTSTTDFVREIKQYYAVPKSLKALCRYIIRNHMKGILVERKIKSLHCPVYIKSYLLLDYD